MTDERENSRRRDGSACRNPFSRFGCSGSGVGHGRKSPAKFYRDVEHGKIAGVCAGIADYFSINRVAVRVVAVILLMIYTVPTAIAYGLMAWLVEPKPKDLYKNERDEAFWRDVRRSPKDTVGEVRMKFRDMDRKLRDIEAYVTSRKFNLDREFEKMNEKG